MTQTEEYLKLKRYERSRTIEAAQRAQKGIPEYGQVDSSGLAIASSYLKSGVNHVLLSLTSNPKDEAKLKREEQINQTVRSQMQKNFGAWEAVETVMDVATVVGAGALIASGVGAGAGVALAGRLVLSKSAKRAIQSQVGKRYLDNVADVAKVAGKKMNVDIDDLTRMTEFQVRNTLKKAGVFKESMKVLNQATHAHPTLSKVKTASGLLAGGVVAHSLIMPKEKRATRVVVEQDHLNQMAQDMKSSSGQTPPLNELLGKNRQAKYGPNHRYLPEYENAVKEGKVSMNIDYSIVNQAESFLNPTTKTAKPK